MEYQSEMLKPDVFGLNSADTMRKPLDGFSFLSSVRSNTKSLWQMSKKSPSFDSLPSGKNDLSFPVLEAMLRQKAGLEHLDQDSQIILGLYDHKSGYTNAGLLFSSENSFPGVEVIRYGNSKKEILARRLFDHQLILEIYFDVSDLFGLFYSMERIEDFERTRFFQIPEAAFQEALANALLTQDWSIKAIPVLIEMFEDRIEITSPGGLPEGMSGKMVNELYERKVYFTLRNLLTAHVFSLLGLSREYGTGSARIQEAYRKEPVKPSFQITENSIKTTLPVIGQFDSMKRDQKRIYSFLKKNGSSSRLDIQLHCGFSRSKTTALLNDMAAANMISRSGKSRSVQYSLL